MRNQEGIKIELEKKVQRRTCVRDITFLTGRPLFSASDVLVESPQYTYIIL